MPIKSKFTAEVTNCLVDLYSRGLPTKEIEENIKDVYGVTIGKTTLYRLLKKKIKLRSISETLRLQNRKNLSIDSMIRLYTKENLSIKQLTESFHKTRNTIKKILIENNVKLKNRGEINHFFRSKFIKPKISPTSEEKAYISGLVIGDFAVQKKSEYTIRLSTGSTNTAFLEMTDEVFKRYGHVMQIYDKYNGNQKVMVDMDLSSFEFLLYAKRDYKQLEEMNDKEFLYFLAGFIDAEGTISISKRKSRNVVEFGIHIYNTNIDILNIILTRLRKLGFHSGITKVRNKGADYYKGKLFVHNYEEYKVYIYRKNEVKKLLEETPLRHPEKIINKNKIIYAIENKIIKLEDFQKFESTSLLHFPKERAGIPYSKYQPSE